MRGYLFLAGCMTLFPSSEAISNLLILCSFQVGWDDKPDTGRSAPYISPNIIIEIRGHVSTCRECIESVFDLSAPMIKILLT